ncbi:hypothetical protein FQA39_LY12789 [Lamprigera yunnana]|nr:hypothetical protein FQA39_LY12789 [Lamprigera yunnana]
MAFTELKHPLIVDKVTRIRKKETCSKDFRENLIEVSQLMVYEAFRDLDLKEVKIVTPVTSATGAEIVTPIVLAPIMRAGLGMANGIQNLIPTAKVAHIGLYRDDEAYVIREYYAKKTENIKEACVVVLDPVVATGRSAFTPGIKLIQDQHPDVDIYTASLDDHFILNGEIEPDLGDAGDRIFGTK